MKTFTSLVLFALVTAALAAEAPVPHPATNTFTIIGMHCDGCARGLTSELKRAPGVLAATVTYSNALAVVALNTNRINSAQLIRVIEEAGFQAKLQQP